MNHPKIAVTGLPSCGIRPRIFITGLAQSGTTYVATLAWQCGLDLGNDLHGGPLGETSHGAEFTPVLRAAQELQNVIGSSHQSQGAQSAAVQRCQSRLSELDCPEVVKLPFGTTLKTIICGLNPQHIIVVTRSLADRAKRIYDNIAVEMSYDNVLRQSAMEFGVCMDMVEESGYPYTTIRFPDCAHSPDLAFQRLGDIFGVSWRSFREAHGRATRLDWMNKGRAGDKI